MSKIFFIGGLGLDSKLVSDISIKKHDLFFIDWFIPEFNESLTSYAKRIVSKYTITNESMIVAVSFGVVLAKEISKIVEIKKIVLISSFDNLNEIPLLFRLAIKLKLYCFLPPRTLSRFSFVLNFFFSITNVSDASILRDVINKTDPIFFKWAIQNILHFTSIDNRTQLIRIHGDKDRILPKGLTKSNYIIKNGGHFMIYDKKNIVNKTLEEIFRS
jgi:hypothetical protein